MSDAVIEGRSTRLVRSSEASGNRFQLWFQRHATSLQTSLGIVVPILTVIAWQVAAQLSWIDRNTYPAPSDIAMAIRDLIGDKLLLAELWVTLRVIFVGFFLGASLGAIVGVITGVSVWGRSALEPGLSVLYVVPKLALLPLLLTMFGFGDTSKVVLVIITVFFFVWIDTMEEIARTPVGYIDAARSFGARRWRLFTHLYWPSALPKLFVALRIAMGVAVLTVIASEFVIGGRGLGYLIFNYTQLYLLDRAYAAILITAVVGVTLTQTIVIVGRVLTPWSKL
jgi:sulfonate transport system permease protein